MAATCDYLVATFAPGDDTEARLPFFYWICGIDEQSKKTIHYGANALVGREGIVGQWNDGRVLIVATGVHAQGVALALRATLPDNRSVARLDLQITIPRTGADEWIAGIEPAKRYKAIRITPANGRGATLYIGAPSSAARLRIYNKSEESGIYANDGSELARVELQVRDKYADAAYRAMLSGAEDEYLMHWLRKMITSADLLNNLSGLLSQSVDVTPLLQKADDGWINRRKAWFERCVVPSIRRLLAVDPDYLHVVQSMLTEPLDVGNGGEYGIRF